MIQNPSSAPRSNRTTRITWRAPESRRRGTLRCLSLAAAATVVLVFAGALSAGAGAALAATTPTPTTPSTSTTPTPPPPSLNSASDHLALTAYKSYLQALVLNANLGRQRDAAMVSTVASSCQNALSQLRGEPSTPSARRFWRTSARRSAAISRSRFCRRRSVRSPNSQPYSGGCRGPTAPPRTRSGSCSERRRPC